MLDQDFRKAFNSAKKRIREMEYRYVEEGDQNRQALLGLPLCYAHHSMTSRLTERSSQFIE
jgi:hypothetical protein